MVMITDAVLDELTHCTESAFVTSDRGNILQRVVKSDFSKRAEISKANFASEELLRNLAARASLHRGVDIDSGEQRLNPFLIAGSRYDLYLRYWKREAVCLEKLHQFAPGRDLDGNRDVLYDLAFVIKNQDLRNLFHRLRFLIHLPKDALALLRVRGKEIEMLAADPFRLVDVGLALFLAVSRLALNAVDTP